MTPSTAVPIIRANDEGEKRWWYGGGVHTWKATSEETGGAFLLFEDLMDEGKPTPWHRHPDVDETLYVVEGEILVRVGDSEESRVRPGGIVVTPRGVPHAFLVTSGPARLLCLQTPGSAEPFFRRASEPVPATGIGTTGPVDFGRVEHSAMESGATEILGPPPFKMT